MFEKLKANILFEKLLKRPDINKAYAMVGPEDSWYQTICAVHNALAEIQKLPHERWDLISHDGKRLQGLFYPGNSDKTMIWVHGYTSHAERESAFPALFYLSMGYNVLIPYLRAHGISEGAYIAFGALEHRDMMQWVEKVNARFCDGSIVLHGLSMGGGVVMDMATRAMKNVKCLVVDAPSYDVDGFLRAVCLGTFKRDGEKVLTHVRNRFRKEFSADPADFDRVKNIADGKYPMLLSAGELEEMESLFHTIVQRNPAPTEMVILPGCNHGNGMYKQTEMYQGAIRTFLEKYMG